jgi:4-amino-4-deoxy-L-arabinose transferase-like glycosyltransferase
MMCLATLLAASALLVAGRLHLPLLEPEEALYAEVPREMLSGGELLVPTLHGTAYLDKPPLLYWLEVGSYRLFGVHLWSARLPPALIALATVAVAYAWGRRCGGPTAGLVSAVVLTLTGDFVYRAPMVTTNGLLALCATSALALGHAAVRESGLRLWLWLASAAVAGLGVLCKGPVALALAGLPLFALCGWETRSVRLTVGAALIYLFAAVAVAAPWFVAVSVRQPEFVEYFFWRHNVERFTQPFDHAKPAYFYLPQVVLGGLPWMFVPVVACFRLFRRKGEGPIRLPPGAFALVAAVWCLVFFSLSGSKRPVYLVPFWPPLAVGFGSMIAAMLTKAGGSSGRVAARAFGGAAVATLVAFGAGVFCWLPQYHERFSLAQASRTISDRAGGAPVFAYPHPWHSLDFHSGAEVPAFGEGDRDRLVARLRDSGRCVLVTKNEPAADDVVADLPNRPVQRYECGLVTVFVFEDNRTQGGHGRR